MGYVHAALGEAERGLVLVLSRYRDGATVGQLEADEYGDGAVPAVAVARLVSLGYVDRYRIGEGCQVLELADRGWRWLLETARARPRAADLPDAGSDELVGWAMLGDLLALVEGRGGSIADVVTLDRLRPRA